MRRNRCRTRPPFTPNNPSGGFHFGPPIPAEGARNSDYNRFAERLELRYTGIKDWLFYAEGEWEEEFGNVDEFQNIDEEIPLDKDTNALGQKYTDRRYVVSDDEIEFRRAVASQNCVIR